MDRPDLTISWRIEVAEKGVYPFLWLKRVWGFEPEKHCAKCLLGEYVRGFAFGAGTREPRAYEGQVRLGSTEEFLYLCGVSQWGYRQNIHWPVEFSPGEITTEEARGIRFEAINAGPLYPIPALPALPGAVGLRAEREFATCRNYQAGYARFGVRQATLL